MDSPIAPKKVSREVRHPLSDIYADGTLHRLQDTKVMPPGLDTSTNVHSKTISITTSNLALTARLYIPSSVLSTTLSSKLPMILYFHGGASIISSPADPKYHNSMNLIVSHSNSLLLALNYRLCPEHPLLAALKDSLSFLHWVNDQLKLANRGHEPWLKCHANFNNIFLAGDGFGANIAHHLALEASRSLPKLSFSGMIMIHPFFWGKEPNEREKKDKSERQKVEDILKLVCPSNKGSEDPLINPFVGKKCPVGMAGMSCRRVLVAVAGKDILRDGGRLNYEMLTKQRGWNEKAELLETEGAGHVFHIIDHQCDKARKMYKSLGEFIQKKKVQN